MDHSWYERLTVPSSFNDAVIEVCNAADLDCHVTMAIHINDIRIMQDELTGPFQSAEIIQQLNYLSATSSNAGTPLGNTLAATIDLLLESRASTEETVLSKEKFGEDFFHLLRSRPQPDIETQEKIFSYAYRYALEIAAKRGGSSSINQETERINNALSKINLKEKTYNEISYWYNNIDRLILRHFVCDPEVKSLRTLLPARQDVAKMLESISKLKEQLETTLAGAEARMSHWKGDLGFVELSDGFRKLRRNKAATSRSTFRTVTALGFGISIIPAIEIIAFVARYMEGSLNTDLIYIAIPTIALELILIYYFKLAFSRYRSIEAQVLQLDHRIALLQFIEKYSTFKSSTAKDLNKFEDLIFSGIVANEDAIPQVFDGTEQLAGLFKSVRGN